MHAAKPARSMNRSASNAVSTCRVPSRCQRSSRYSSACSEIGVRPTALTRYRSGFMSTLLMNPIGYVRSPYRDTAAIPKGLGAEHHAEGVLEISAEFEAGL